MNELIQMEIDLPTVKKSAHKGVRFVSPFRVVNLISVCNLTQSLEGIGCSSDTCLGLYQTHKVSLCYSLIVQFVMFSFQVLHI